jgi:hypothetical protein
MLKSWEILALFAVAEICGCRSREPCSNAVTTLHASGRIAVPPQPPVRERHHSRQQTGESGQFGLTTLVDVGDDTSNLSSTLKQELVRSRDHHERCLFMTMVSGCPSCASLGYAIYTGSLSRLAGKIRVVRIDLDEFESEARNLSLPIDRVPGFFLVGDSGKVQDFLDASEWDTNNPAEFAPIIAKFLDRSLEHRRHAWSSELESRVIDL